MEASRRDEGESDHRDHEGDGDSGTNPSDLDHGGGTYSHSSVPTLVPLPWMVRYEEAVMTTPEIVSQVESIVKGLSFCIPESVPWSEEVAEAVYAGAKLLTFSNDWTIRRCFAETEDACGDSDGDGSARWSGASDAQRTSLPTITTALDRWTRGYNLYATLLSLLTAIEHSSVFLELFGHTFFNARWVFILAFESIRAAARSVLLARFGATLLGAQPITDLDRTKLICNSCKCIRTSTCCANARGSVATHGDNSSFLQPTSTADDCPACGQPLQIQDVVGTGDPPLSVGRRTGRVLRPPSKPKPMFGGLLGESAPPPDNCPECREWKTRHRQLLSMQRMLRLPVPTKLTSNRLAAEALCVSDTTTLMMLCVHLLAFFVDAFSSAAQLVLGVVHCGGMFHWCMGVGGGCGVGVTLTRFAMVTNVGTLHVRCCF
eukprot:m.53294 g.53294  ORF g.53294 m.53294 type:complete len:432 (-) comp7443_c0_seq1:585-1880(-)